MWLFAVLGYLFISHDLNTLKKLQQTQNDDTQVQNDRWKKIETWMESIEIHSNYLFCFNALPSINSNCQLGAVLSGNANGCEIFLKQCIAQLEKWIK